MIKLKLLPSNWTLIQQRNNFNLVYSQKLKIIAQQYHLRNLTTQEKQQWRQRVNIQHQNIIQILDHTWNEQEIPEEDRRGKVLIIYTQVISCRLSELLESEFDYEEQWLLQCLKGFEKLYKEYGGFKVRPSMIAITPQHKARVWINPNFLKNSKLQSTQNETILVNSIIKLFKKVNIVIPEHEISFKRMIDFMEKQVLSKGGLQKVRSKSDILYIDKLEFKKQEQKDWAYHPKSTLSDLHKQKIKGLLQYEKKEQKNVYQSGIENGKMKKDSMTTQNSSINDREGTIATILSQSTYFQKKIKMLDEILRESNDQELRRFGLVYKHALLHNDRLLLKQIHSVKGKLAEISKPSFVNRINEILEQEERQKEPTIKPPRPHISSLRVNQILNNERVKRSTHSTHNIEDKSSMQELKGQISKLLFD